MNKIFFRDAEEVGAAFGAKSRQGRAFLWTAIRPIETWWMRGMKRVEP